jgi:hypothetical protein
MITSTPNLSRVVWRKSSYSANGANCVEVARNLPGTVAVRDSKNVPGPELAVSRQAWAEFVKGIKHGEFDLC